MRNLTGVKERKSLAGRKTGLGKHIRKSAVCYGIICALVAALAAAGVNLIPGFPSEALAGTLKVLFPGGVVVFLMLKCFCPTAEQSEFYRIFEILYHPAIWLLAIVIFAEKSGTWSGVPADSLHMAYIAGWTLLAAGIIILILIIKEKHN